MVHMKKILKKKETMIKISEEAVWIKWLKNQWLDYEM